MTGSLDRSLLGWLTASWIGFSVLPRYALEDGLLSGDWLAAGWIFDRDAAPGLIRASWHGKPWLWVAGDPFVAASIGLVVAMVGLFVFFPVGTVLTSAFSDNTGAFDPGLFLGKFGDGRIWALACLWSDRRCGVA